MSSKEKNSSQERNTKKTSAVPDKHWEMHYSLSKPSRNMELTEGADFVAKNPTNRKTTYLKINSEDH